MCLERAFPISGLVKFKIRNAVDIHTVNVELIIDGGPFDASRVNPLERPRIQDVEYGQPDAAAPSDADVDAAFVEHLTDEELRLPLYY